MVATRGVLSVSFVDVGADACELWQAHPYFYPVRSMEASNRRSA